LLCVQWKTPDDGQRNCPKHVEFYSKNKFEKLVHLIGFIIRIYHCARSPERQIHFKWAFFFCRHTQPSYTLNKVALYNLSSFCHTTRYQKPKDNNAKVHRTINISDNKININTQSRLKVKFLNYASPNPISLNRFCYLQDLSFALNEALDCLSHLLSLLERT